MRKIEMRTMVMVMAASLAVAGCGGGGGGDDDGVDSGATSDATVRRDGALTSDASADVDAAVTGPDAAVTPDAAMADAATPDAQQADAQQADATVVATGESCAAPTVIGVGTQLAQTTVGFANDLSGATSGVNNCTGSDDGRDRVYQISVPAMNRLVARVVPVAGFDPSIYLVESPSANCTAAPRVCLTSNDAGGTGDPDEVRFVNDGGSARTVFIVIDNFSSTDTGGVFDLVVALETPPVGDLCQTATTLGAGSHPNQTTVGFGNDYFGGDTLDNCSEADLGLDRVYAISVPANNRLTATVTPTSGGNFDPSLELIAAPATMCDASPRVCLAGDDSGGTVDANTVTYVNNGATAAPVLLVIDSFRSSDTGGVFTLDIRFDPPMAGDRCQGAEALSGTQTGQTTVDYQNNYGYVGNDTCFESPGPDRVYAVTIPVGQRLTTTVTPAAGFDPTINVLSQPAGMCDVAAPVCLASLDSEATGAAEVLVLGNGRTTPHDVFVSVDSYTAAGNGSGTFELASALTAMPAGDACPSAPLITPGMLMSQTTIGYSGEYHVASPTCDFYDSTDGLDRVYQIAVGDGQTLSATVMPVAGADLGIFLVAGPATACDDTQALACLAGNDLGGNGMPDNVTYLNNTGATRNVFILIDNYQVADTGGDFSLVTTLSP